MAAQSVSQLTSIIRGAIMGCSALEDVLVEGEISNLSQPASGHIYLTLKDERAGIGCVMFRTNAQRVPFQPGNGMRVIAHGHIEIYDQQGRYQLYLDRLEPSGVGALALAVQQRLAALAAEGLFDDRHKRPLPLLPARVVVVTSRSGAAWRDILTVTRRRAPCIDVVLSPATVQGESAVDTVVSALGRAAEVGGAEVVLLCRGGGSLEDLMAFNDERVARAIRACPLPVVCGVGHEIDTTIADLAADHRAATPSAAAELVAPDCSQLRQQLMDRTVRLGLAVRQELAHKRTSLERMRVRLDYRSPLRRLPGHRQELDMRVARLRGALLAGVSVKRRRAEGSSARLTLLSPARSVALERIGLVARRQRLEAAVGAQLVRGRSALGDRRGRLEALSPLRTLQRGYSITVDANTGTVVGNAADLRVGQLLRTRLAAGEARSRVEGSTTSVEQMYDAPRVRGKERIDP